MGEWVSWWIRETPPSVRWPNGLPREKVRCFYTDAELMVMRALKAKAIAAPAGSEERQEALNEIATVHETKHFLGAEMVDESAPAAEGEAEQNSLFEQPDSVPEDSFFQIPGKAQAKLADPSDKRIGKFSDPEVSGAPVTQRQAAITIYPRSGTYRRGVLDAIAKAGERGMTDVELYGVTGWDQNTVRPRRNELMNDGWIEDSGNTRPTPSEKNAVVWVLTAAGREGYGKLPTAP